MPAILPEEAGVAVAALPPDVVGNKPEYDLLICPPTYASCGSNF